MRGIVVGNVGGAARGTAMDEGGACGAWEEEATSSGTVGDAGVGWCTDAEVRAEGAGVRAAGVMAAHAWVGVMLGVGDGVQVVPRPHEDPRIGEIRLVKNHMTGDVDLICSEI